MTASKVSLGKSGKSTITADLTHDSSGVYHNPANGHIPDYLQIIFTSNVGGVTSPRYVFSGNATTTFTAGTTSNNATVSAALDDQTVQIKLTVDAKPPTAAASVKGGLYNANKNVTLKAADDMDSNPKIYYTTNGSSPAVKGALYKGPIAITKTTTLNFVAVDAAGNNSPIYTENYTIDTTKPTANAAPRGGIFKTSKTVTLTSTDNVTKNPKIYYTTGGATPTPTSKRYTGPISVNATTTLRFMVVDDAGNRSGVMIETYTIDRTAPKITSLDPANGETKVAVSKTIKATFTEVIKLGSGTVELKNSNGKRVALNKLWISGGKTLIIDPQNNLAESLYTLTIHTGAVTDLAGNPVALKSTKFSVGTSPAVKTSDPKNSATKVSRSKSIAVTFNENIKACSNCIELVTSSGKSVAIIKSIRGKVLTIKHSTKLSADTRYKLVIHTSGITDLAGNPVSVKIITFKTGG